MDTLLRLHWSQIALLIVVLFVVAPLVLARVAGFNNLGDDEA